jgi:hypothetical protein
MGIAAMSTGDELQDNNLAFQHDTDPSGKRNDVVGERGIILT